MEMESNWNMIIIGLYVYYFNSFLDELWRRFNNLIENFCENYAVYHYFRSKGWVVKDGTKFGVNFLLYQEGPAFYHAQYSVKIATEVLQILHTVHNI